MKGTKSKVIGIIVIILATVILWKFIDLLPIIGDPDSAPNTHISRVYIERGPKQTNSPNLVTGVLADYRGLDTMLETTVIYLASIAVTLIMSNKTKKDIDLTSFEQIRIFGRVEIKVIMPVLIPVLLIYAIYVLVHGEVSLGGGFQAGALIALAYILYSLTQQNDRVQRFHISQFGLMCFGAGGILLYFTTGLLSVLAGGKFLEYGMLPFTFLSYAQRHSVGIFMIETGVTICVAASIITILEAILERKSIDDGN